jgi:tRNA nucleotidyltransferase (CCA-adding enzyme)
MPDDLKNVILKLPTSRAYLVGGCVRDHFLGLTPKDFDVEIYGMDYDTLTKELSNHGAIDLVGKAFAVIKITLPSGETHDFSLPRKDSKNGHGHKDFSISTDPSLNETEGASRRDITINSLSWNPKTK